MQIYIIFSYTKRIDKKRNGYFTLDNQRFPILINTQIAKVAKRLFDKN